MLDEYDYRFDLGKAGELRSGRDVVLISTGLMTMRALQAAARPEVDRVDVAVLHVPTIKPFDTEAILRAARTDRLVVTLENHTVIGGDAAHELEEQHGVQAVGIGCDITDENSVESALAVLDGALAPGRRAREQRRHHLSHPLPASHRRWRVTARLSSSPASRSDATAVSPTWPT